MQRISGPLARGLRGLKRTEYVVSPPIAQNSEQRAVNNEQRRAKRRTTERATKMPDTLTDGSVTESLLADKYEVEHYASSRKATQKLWTFEEVAQLSQYIQCSRDPNKLRPSIVVDVKGLAISVHRQWVALEPSYSRATCSAGTEDNTHSDQLVLHNRRNIPVARRRRRILKP